MGIADSFRQLAEKAKARMAGTEDSVTDDNDLDLMDEKYDNAARDRFDMQRDGAQEALNERTDDFGGGRRGMRNNRDITG